MFVHLLVNWIVSENARWKQYKIKKKKKQIRL
jgi:hypothetical protein